MEIFLDTFEHEAIAKYASLIAGITTNPLVLSKSVENKDAFLLALNKIVTNFPDLLITLQVTEDTSEKMYEEACKIRDLCKNVVIKVPLIFEGVKALKKIVTLGAKTNATLCFSLFQAKIAEDLGATYISPFLGRMESANDNIKEFAMNLTSTIKHSKILAASIRNLRHAEIAMQANCAAITLNETVFDMLFNSPLLLNGKQLFDEASRFKFL